MSEQRKLFRRTALERLSTPERLDELITVTSPRGWLTLVALLLVAAGFVTWGVRGSIASRVAARGILMGGSVYDVVPVAAGQVQRVLVGVGDRVAAGAVIAELDQPELTRQVREARARLQELETQDAELRSYGAQDVRARLNLAVQQRASVEQSLRGDSSRLAFLLERSSNEESLMQRGLLSRQQWAATQQEIAEARNRQAGSAAELKAIESRELNAGFDRDRQLSLSRQRIDETRRQLQQHTAEHALRSRVVSPYAGSVLEALVERGDLVSAGMPIVKLALAEGADRLHAALYVATSDGKKIQSGMRVQVAPSTVKPEESGYLIADVIRVSDFPATRQAMLLVLKNPALVDQLSSGGPPFEVMARLVPDSLTSSGYRWTSRRGPNVPVLSGTPATAWIVVQKRKPVELLLPALRKRFLGS